MLHYRTHSSAETKALGTTLAKKMLARPKRARYATVIALQGDLGAGKTTFVQGFVRGIGYRGRVMSPTFILFRRLALSKRSASKGRFQNVYHVDAYRIRNASEFSALGFKEILKDPRNVVLIEWPERLKGLLPRDTMRIFFEHGSKESERKIIHQR